MKEITDLSRIGHYVDEDRKYWLAVSVQGLPLEKGETVWIWVRKPERVGPPGGYGYVNDKRMDECTNENSMRVELAGQPTNSRGENKDRARLWIPLAVADTAVSGVRYLLVSPDLLDIEGWGRDLPT
jgi:hypothetical protein